MPLFHAYYPFARYLEILHNCPRGPARVSDTAQPTNEINRRLLSLTLTYIRASIS